MSNAVRTTYPMWHQPWACFACQKHGLIGVQVANIEAEDTLRKVARGINDAHRQVSPLCMQDISTKYQGKMALTMCRPYRQGKSGTIIYASLPTEEQATANMGEPDKSRAQAVLAARAPHAPWKAWPPWLQ